MEQMEKRANKNEKESSEEDEGALAEWEEPKKKYDNGKPQKTQKVQQYYTDQPEEQEKKGKKGKKGK